jgi:hypothetical protein
MLDRGLCEIAVTRNGVCLEYAKSFKKDREVCAMAVRQNPFAMKFVADELRDLAMYQEADPTLDEIPPYEFPKWSLDLLDDLENRLRISQERLELRACGDRDVPGLLSRLTSAAMSFVGLPTP